MAQTMPISDSHERWRKYVVFKTCGKTLRQQQSPEIIQLKISMLLNGRKQLPAGFTDVKIQIIIAIGKGANDKDNKGKKRKSELR